MLRTDGPILLCNHLSKKIAQSFFICAVLGGCVTADRPNLEYVLTREAFVAAQEVDAAKYSPANYLKAEELYRKAMVSYKKRDFESAVADFRTARVYAERAENSARAQRQKAGEEAL
jgi:hypothetical protein